MAREFAKAFYNSKEWEEVREFCLKRDSYLCTEPGCFAPAEEVHHIQKLTPSNIGDTSITLNPDNLRCLCREHHMQIHRADRNAGRFKVKPPEQTFDEHGFLIKIDQD